MASDEIPTSKLHELASRVRRENIEAIAYRCMKLDDTTMDELKNNNPKDVDFKYNVFVKWVHISGARMGDLKALFVKAISDSIPVEPWVRNDLGIQQQGLGRCK